jgi:hypothetical protein
MIPEDKHAEYADILARDGIVVIEDYLDEETCDELYERVISGIEDDRYADGDEFDGYQPMANADQPVLNERTGADEGMFDIFNMDTVVEELKNIEVDEDVQAIINRTTDTEYRPTNINTYIRRSVSNPAPYHADSFTTFKSFVYLTDVPDRTYGPFSFVPGSHDPPTLEKFGTVMINSMKGNAGAPRAIVPKPSEANHVTGSKGTLIIANQAGYHRALPQSEGRERVLVTTRYKSDKNQVDLLEGVATKIGQMLG